MGPELSVTATSERTKKDVEYFAYSRNSRNNPFMGTFLKNNCFIIKLIYGEIVIFDFITTKLLE